eukprot:g419.t1
MKQSFRRPKDREPVFKKEVTYFYAFEPDWQTMVEGRLDTTGAQTSTYDCTFKYDADKKVSASLKVGLSGIAGLDLGGESDQHLSVNEKCTVKFWDAVADSGRAEDR